MAGILGVLRYYLLISDISAPYHRESQITNYHGYDSPNAPNSYHEVINQQSVASSAGTAGTVEDQD